MIIKNTSSETVVLKKQGGGRVYLGSGQSVNSTGVENWHEFEDKVKITEDLTEVTNASKKINLNEICSKKGQSING